MKPLPLPSRLRRSARSFALAACALLALALPFSAPHAQPAQDAAPLLARLYAPEAGPRAWPDKAAAMQALALLRTAPAHGLDPDLYDVETLAARLGDLDGDGEAAAAADRLFSQAVLQFLSDLHGGRAAPDALLPAAAERADGFDAVALLRQAIAAGRLQDAAARAAPRLPNYARVQASLQRYRALAALETPWKPPSPLPAGGKLAAGQLVAGLDRLRERLQLLGDLDPAEDAEGPASERHSAALGAAIMRFQARHGLAENGRLDRDTLAALAVPLSHRVRQLELTLERLRWLPPLRPGRVIVVNVAAFRLWAFDSAAGPAAETLDMRVIVGKAARTQTPLFIGQMRHLEFNPYWNVPPSIALGEIVPKLARNPAYLAQNGMELVSRSGQVVGGAPSVAQIRAGQLRIRQRPGAHNVLGAVKFAMPNPMNIYLHSTSARELFGRTRRDLSHGCIRVERPAELAAFVLAGQEGWDAQAVEAAMAPGPNRTVKLAATIPVVLFYATAATDRSGRALFAQDIYRRDEKLMRALQAR